MSARLTYRRCPSRFVEENGQWHRCILNDDAHETHVAILRGKTTDADIRWNR